MVFMPVGLPPRPAMEATLMMRPERRGIMLATAAAWLITNRLRMFRSITLSQASSGCSSAAAPQVAPALLTRMSMRPRRSMASATMRRPSSGRAASAATQRASMPLACRWAAASSRSAALRELSRIFAPASPRASAICRPRPREPPVTTAVWPLRSKSFITGVLISGLLVGIGSETGVLHVAADRLAAGHHAQPGVDLGQLVQVEEAQRGQQAGGAVAFGLGGRRGGAGGQAQLQPDPGQQHMAEGLQIGRGIGQGLFGHAGGPGGLGGG